LIDKTLKPIIAQTPENEVAHLFEQRDLISAPVVDENNQLIGRITIDDVHTQPNTTAFRALHHRRKNIFLFVQACH
jgi:Mg/Co/Ni transporter MgtE